MCIILVGRVNKALHKQALQQNGDGFSVFTEADGLIKAPTAAQVKKALNTFAIWHYRIATSGKVNDDNIHPFEICNGKYLLYHNGVLGNGVGDKSDTAVLAELLYDVDIEVASSVIESVSHRSRFLIASATNPKDFRVFGDWEFDAGVLMSHKMYKPVYKTYTSKVKRGIKDWEDDINGKALTKLPYR